jgi:hypothetical protein
MARVVMSHYISGGRGDGAEWPHAGGVLECGDDEARALVAGGNARWPEHAGVAAPAAEPAATAPAAGPAGDEPPEPDSGSQGVTAPSVREPKKTWEMHAVSLGVTAELAAAMTKADLIRFSKPA